MGFLLKTTEETYVYEEDAAVVAQTCIDVLGRLGKVTKVERDSGIILGKIKPKVFMTIGFTHHITPDIIGRSIK